ncbi:MAG: DNA double-strand break repair nuclease NurA [Anaerolineae bacterium]|nr:DNA double-strand break repair nuclease NurA [Anaerolineae bacterium]
MTLEFEKVVPQVERMGRAVAAHNMTMSERLLDAWEWFAEMGDLGAIHERIQLARDRDAGFRGAAPLKEINEPVNYAYPLPAVPPRATIIAADGSQVYPDLHAAALYYLTNIGVLVYHHGTDALPEPITDPRLHYTDEFLRDEHGQMVTNTAVNARRTVTERQVLAREAWDRRDIDAPLVAISDGPLLFWVGNDVPDGRRLEQDYMGALVHMHDTHAAMQRDINQTASLAGYVDRPTSTFAVSLIHLMSLHNDDVRRAILTTNGDLEGLTDKPLMFKLLRPGERSALLVQQSPQNKNYHDKGENYEIVFFYLNVGAGQDYHLARVEIPMWVARVPAMVDNVHALVYDQCQVMWRYPYALTRADELAVIRAHERSQLGEMIEIELRRNQQAVEHSEKLDSKAVRHGRTRYGQKRHSR